MKFKTMSPQQALETTSVEQLALHRCPFCHTAVDDRQTTVNCRRCLAEHHRACWEESRACSSCRSPLNFDPERVQVSRRLAWGGGLALVLLLGVAVVVGGFVFIRAMSNQTNASIQRLSGNGLAGVQLRCEILNEISGDGNRFRLELSNTSNQALTDCRLVLDGKHTQPFRELVVKTGHFQPGAEGAQALPPEPRSSLSRATTCQTTGDSRTATETPSQQGLCPVR